MARKDEYGVLINDRYDVLRLEDIARLQRHFRIWSARLSTGLLGKTNCPSGNKGPKGYSEVLLAIGDKGLRKLIELGFITCPVCHPENVAGFWDIIQDTVQEKYGIESLKNFVDKKLLPFDARRVIWEEIIPCIGDKWPSRLYVPENLSKHELIQFKIRLEKIEDYFLPGYRTNFPSIGYYNPDVPERFTPYQLYG
ncbi:hypothetical protein MYX06_01065 [Patescibacteria group bacterium AH-259-L05]|nr:hypothetical protein [Patescibacteria group bacterium AH-259-L05]